MPECIDCTKIFKKNKGEKRPRLCLKCYYLRKKGRPKK